MCAALGQVQTGPRPCWRKKDQVPERWKGGGPVQMFIVEQDLTDMSKGTVRK